MRLGLIDPQLPAHLKTSYEVLVRGSARVAGPPCGVHPKKSAPCAVVGFSSRFPLPFHPVSWFLHPNVHEFPNVWAKTDFQKSSVCCS